LFRWRFTLEFARTLYVRKASREQKKLAESIRQPRSPVAVLEAVRRHLRNLHLPKGDFGLIRLCSFLDGLGPVLKLIRG